MAGLRTSALAVLLCLHWHHVNVKAGTLFADPGDDVFFNFSISRVASTDGFIAVEKHLDDKHNVMVFLNMVNPPDIPKAYMGRIHFTGNIGRTEMNFWLHNVSIEDAGEFRVVPVGIRKVLGSQILAVAGRPGNPTIVERTIPQVYKDHTMECTANSSSRPETNGFNMSFIWKLNGTILVNNLVRIVQGKILIIRRLQREDRFDNFTCIAYDSVKLPSNESKYYQIDPYYGPSEELTLDPPNRTYLVEEGSMLASTTCSADCHPHCIFSWDRGERHGAKLYLGVIDKSKSGIYRCTAQNPVTNVSFTTALEVILSRCYLQPVKNCCLPDTCKDEKCSLSYVIRGNGHRSCAQDYCLDAHEYSKIGTERAERNGFPVTMVSVVGSAAFATMCLNLLFCISQVLQGQVSKEVLEDGDKNSDIDELFTKEIVPSAETILK